VADLEKFQALLERAPFNILTDDPGTIDFISTRSKLGEKFPGTNHKTIFLSDGNPAQVLCCRSVTDNAESSRQRNPLLHLRETLDLVVAQLCNLKAAKCEKLRDRKVKLAKKMRTFSTPKPTMDGDAAFDVGEILRKIERTNFNVELNNNEW
jgi:hypothetical protein